MKQSLNDSFKALGATIKAAYGLAPCAVIVGIALAAGITWLTLQWQSLMIGTASMMVVLVSLCIFAVRENFGEAMLSLVGGLLTIFAFEWTSARYIAFMTVWFGFAFAAVLISSIKLAARSEDIYRMAALRIAKPGEDHSAVEKELKRIGRATPLRMLGPIDRAEIIRVLVFRKLPIELLAPCLNAVETLSVITQCDNKSISIFLADFLLSLSADSRSEARHLVDTLYDVIREVPVPPEDFFAAFETSRRLLLSRTIPPITFLRELRECLSSGVAPEDVYEEMLKQIHGTAGTLAENAP